MRKQFTVLTLMLAVLLAGALPVLASANTEQAVSYLQTQQNSDGGFGSGFSPDSTISSTADVVLALVSVGVDPATFDQGGNTPLTYLASKASSANTSGDLAKLIQATIATGETPRNFGGVDSVQKLESMVGSDGRIGGDMDTFVSHTLAILALKSAQRSIPPAAVDYVKSAQQEGGGWAWDGTAETAADTNTTAFAVQALLAAGETADSEAVGQALAYYKGIQNEDGGWPYQSPSDFGTDTDANSTAVTIQALIAAGEDPASAQWTKADGSTPVSALEALQNESGAWAWQAAIPDDNLLATIQALPAVAGKAFPLASMNVGTPEAMPISLPETGGASLGLTLPMVLSGLALAGAGYALRRRK